MPVLETSTRDLVRRALTRLHSAPIQPVFTAQYALPRESLPGALGDAGEGPRPSQASKGFGKGQDHRRGETGTPFPCNHPRGRLPRSSTGGHGCGGGSSSRGSEARRRGRWWRGLSRQIERRGPLILASSRFVDSSRAPVTLRSCQSALLSTSNPEAPPDVPGGGNLILFCCFVELRPTDQADSLPLSHSSSVRGNAPLDPRNASA
jgi:hypothetical protein